MSKFLGITAAFILAPLANAQPVGTVTWFFNARTADGDDIIEPHLGENLIEIEIWADMDPDVDGIEGSVIGFSGTIFDFLNVDNGETGRIMDVRPSSYLDRSEWHMSIGPFGVRNMEPFQLPPSFEPPFDASDPIYIATVTWSALGDPTPRTMLYETSTIPDGIAVYSTSMGQSRNWAVSESQIAWSVVPAPSSLAAIVLAHCALSTRRRPTIRNSP